MKAPNPVSFIIGLQNMPHSTSLSSVAGCVSTGCQSCPDGGNGRRRRLKISGAKARAGSSPAPGTHPGGKDLSIRLAKLLAAALLAAPAVAAAPEYLPEIPYPFADDQEFWINSPPLADRDLAGRVVVVMFWTYGCYNCKNSLAWINDLYARIGNDRNLAIIGVHTPEFESEKDKGSVRSHARRFAIEFPVMIDNDFHFWNAMGNQWWPAFYVADRQGRLRGSYFGEVHSGTDRAQRIESLISALLSP